MLRFRLFGVPFEVGPYFWVGSALLGSSLAHGAHAVALLAVWMACVFVSIIVHELGHALVAARFGVAPRVTLHWLGGTTFMGGSQLTRVQGILVSLAGPAAGLATWALTRGVAWRLFATTPHANYLAAYAVVFLLFINLYWTLFNLLPILPLDGGQVLRNALGPARLPLARMIGAIVAVVFCALSALEGQTYVAIFLGFLAWANFRPPAGGVL